VIIGTTTFDCHWISMESWVGTKSLVFFTVVAPIDVLFICEILVDWLKVRELVLVLIIYI
jgi:hypothetical protein